MTKPQATAAGKKLLKKMKGRGWRLKVWENMGWHYRVVSGPVQVNEDINPWHKGKPYWAMIGDDPKVALGGLANWTPRGISFASDPNKAVEIAFECLDKVLKQYNEVRTATLKAMGY